MKYALLNNDQIKVGPREYNVTFFRAYLEDNNISTNSVPVTYTGSDPIIITDSISIVPVSDPIIPEYNPYTEQLAGPYWDATAIPITGYYEVSDVAIDSAKNIMKSELASNRYNQEVSVLKTTVQGTDVSIPTNRGYDRDIWFQMLALLPEGSVQKFKFDGGIWLDLTKTDIQTIVSEMVLHVQTAFDWEAGKVVDIDAATSKSELEAIDINWPTEE
nr:MAG: hypothetical protein [Caudoviricetes sp.]